MFGYNCPEHIDLVEAVTPYIEDIVIVKDYSGSAFLPEFNFNGIGMLNPGEGYQIKVLDNVNSFRLCDWYVTDIPYDQINNFQDSISELNNLINTQQLIIDSLEAITETNFEIVVDPLEYLISDIDILTTCGGILYDSGGPDGSYINNENHSITIYPENQGEYVSLFFSSFELETCCDYLTIYDGVGVSSPVLQTGSNGSSLNGLTFYASPTNESGALTITFTTDGSVTYPGFSAEIGCTTYGPCFGFDVNVLSTFE